MRFIFSVTVLRGGVTVSRGGSRFRGGVTVSRGGSVLRFSGRVLNVKEIQILVRKLGALTVAGVKFERHPYKLWRF